MQPFDLMPQPEPKTLEDYFNQHTFRSIVWPHAWHSVNQKHQLSWQWVRFTKPNKAKVADARGVYSFVIRLDAPSLPSNNYISYIGITGNERERTLRDRYGDYLNDKRRGSKRPKMNKLFQLWGDELDFWFVPLPDKSVDLEELERDLNSAILPPFVENDVHPGIRATLKISRMS